MTNTDQAMANALNKASVLGIDIIEEKYGDSIENTCAIIKKNNNIKIYIGSKVEKAPVILILIDKYFGMAFNSSSNNIKIIGGESLKDMNSMFSQLEVGELDLSKLIMKPESMMDTFEDSSINKLIQPEIVDFTHLGNANGCFKFASINEIKIHNQNFAELNDLYMIFTGAIIGRLEVCNCTITKMLDASSLLTSASINEIYIDNVRFLNLNEALDMLVSEGSNKITCKNLYFEKLASVSKICKNYNTDPNWSFSDDSYIDVIAPMWSKADEQYLASSAKLSSLLHIRRQ